MATATTATATAPPLGLVFSTTPAAQPPPGQPDISYHPDWQKYQARVARRTQNKDLPKSLPAGFPKELKGDLVWEGASLAQKYDWTFVFSSDQLVEIDNAVIHFKCKLLALEIAFCVAKTYRCKWLTTASISPQARPWLHNAGHVSSPHFTC
jgi:hypothetical protein